jgi:hypothetical protein
MAVVAVVDLVGVANVVLYMCGFRHGKELTGFRRRWSLFREICRKGKVQDRGQQIDNGEIGGKSERRRRHPLL